MSDSNAYLQSVLGGVLDIAGDYVRSGVKVAVKTNLGPEIQIFSGSAQGGQGGGGGFSLARVLGLKAAVVVRDPNGKVLASFGDVPATEPLKVVVALLLAAGLVYLVVRGVKR